MKKVLTVVVILALTVVGLIAATRTSGTTIAEAIAKKVSVRILETQAESVGLSCSGFYDIFHDCEKMISRAKKNSRLKEAFLHAQTEGVNVWPETWLWFSAGSVGAGYVEVNSLASDEKIIAFLTN